MTRRCFALWVGSMAALYGQTKTPLTIPAGTPVAVRTLDEIRSKQADVGQSYRCTLQQPIQVGNQELASRGGDSDEAEQHSGGKSNKIPA